MLESIIVISLLGLVGLSFAYLFSMSQRFMIQSMDSATSQGDAAFALEHIKRHVITATVVSQPAAGASGAVLEFTWQPTSNAGATGQVRTSRYEVNGTDLRFIPNTGAGGFEVVSQGITSITFNRATAGTVSVDVTARKTTGGDSRDMRLQTSISPRGLFQ